MNLAKQIRAIMGLAALLGLAACGGGGSSSNGSTGGGGPTGAVPVDVTVVGSITGFGSVWVNGTKYEVASDTRVSIEDEAERMGDDSQLRLGMVVRMSAVDNNGVRTARSIEVDEDLKGPIESITPNANDLTIGTFSVMSQIVTVDGGTVFDDDIGNNDGVAGIDFRDLQVGMVVEVNGFPTEGGFLATRVDRELDGLGGNPDVGRPDVDGDELELKGFVESIADDESSLVVSGVTFALTPGTIFEDGLALGSELIGMFVEIKADIVGGSYMTVRIQAEDSLDDDDRNGEFEIEGVLQSVNTDATPNTFTINGITVPVSNASPLTALVGMRVEIKGSFNGDGVLVMREAEQDLEDNVRTEDLVSSVNVGGVSFTTRLGLTISPAGGSGVEDKTSDDGDHLTPEQFINRLQMGDRIEARGNDLSASGVSWTRIERDEIAADNDDFECELRGTVDSIDGDASSFSFVIQGITVLTGRVTENNFQDANDLGIGKAEFFDRLQTGDVVAAESFEGNEYCMTGTLDAREVEFEPADAS
ncbi:MAG: DUF5666 domain-containing protein [Gammaproteobacteria bacterium]|nr:DUF5666 domain-containing protein [Gammaproteobacteria bacterium]